MEGDANDEFAPPMPAPKRRNAVLRLYDAPVYRDWPFWLTAVVAITSGFAIATGERTSAMPVWLDTALAVLVMATLFAVLPAWLRLLLRRRLWRIRKRRGQAPGRPAATADPESGPPVSAPVRNLGHTASTPAKEQARGPVNVNATSRNNVQAPQREHRQLPYPIARAVRGYDLAATPKEKYDALLDTAEALTITLEVTAAALFRSTNHSEFLARLRDAYVNNGARSDQRAGHIRVRDRERGRQMCQCQPSRLGGRALYVLAGQTHRVLCRCRIIFPPGSSG